ncbi:MAG: GNAT family N-acetyltransferase [Capsulimonadales bacterium]|nr:GNAT family N-acetyltransferase [Capsulimonadales bacterium]
MPIQHTPEGFATFCRLHHLDIAQSVQLRDDSGNVVGQAMLGIRDRRGWCGGFGIVPEFRGKRLATALIDGLLDRARLNGLKVLQLEVLCDNEPALRTYRRAGFVVRREVISFAGPIAENLHRTTESAEVRPVPILEAIARFALNETLWETSPVWQRQIALLYLRTDLRAFGATANDGTAQILYGFQTATGFLRIDRLDFDSEAAARAVLRRAINEAAAALRDAGENRPIKWIVLNEPTDTPLYALLDRLMVPITYRQYEMSLDL